MTKTVEAACGVIIKDKKVLLIQRSEYEKKFPLYWGFPGGKKEKDESVEEASIREVKEEVNLDFLITKLVGVYPFDLTDKHVLSYAFLGESDGNIKINQAEVKTYGWFTYKQSKKLDLAFSYEKLLDDLHQKKLIK